MDLNFQIRKLYEILNRELEYFPRDEKFYPIREIISKFKTNRRVADGALARMEEEGLLRKIPRVGYFSNVNRCSPVKNILLLKVDYPSSFWSEWQEHLQKAFDASGRFRMQQQLFAYDRPVFQNFNAGIYDAVLVMQGAVPLQHREMQELGSLTIPLVLLDCNAGLLSVSSVCSDHYQGGMLSADHLIRKGHKRIIIINSEPDTENITARKNGFLSYARLQGVEPVLLDCHTRSGEKGSIKSYRLLSEYLEKNGHDFSALALLCESCVSGVYAALQDHNLRIPEDVSVIGYDGVCDGELCRPALTTVSNDFDRMAQEVIKGLDGVFHSGKPFNPIVPMSVIERNSIKDLTNLK